MIERIAAYSATPGPTPLFQPRRPTFWVPLNQRGTGGQDDQVGTLYNVYNTNYMMMPSQKKKKG